MQSTLCPAPSSFSQPLLDHTQFLQPWLNNQIITDVISRDSALVLPYVKVNYSVLNLTTGELYFKVQCNATVMFYQWNRIDQSPIVSQYHGKHVFTKHLFSPTVLWVFPSPVKSQPPTCFSFSQMPYKPQLPLLSVSLIFLMGPRMYIFKLDFLLFICLMSV